MQEGSHNFWMFDGMFHESSPFFNGTILEFVQSASFGVMMDFWMQITFWLKSERFVAFICCF